LAATQVYTFFSDLCQISSRQNFEITFQFTETDGVDVPLLVEGQAIQDVVANGHVLNPRTLLHERHFTVDLDDRVLERIVGVDEILLETSKFMILVLCIEARIFLN